MANDTKIVLPDPEDLSPEYGALVAKRRELEARKVALVDAERRIWNEVHRGGKGARPTGRDRAVAELLGDAVDDVPDEGNLEAQLKTARADLAAVTDAQDVLAGRITIARAGASEAVADAIRDPWTARFDALVEHLVAAKALADELEEVRYAASLRNVHFMGRLPLMTFTAVSEKIRVALDQVER